MLDPVVIAPVRCAEISLDVQKAAPRAAFGVKLIPLRVAKLAAQRIPQRAAAIQVDRMREPFVEKSRSRIQDRVRGNFLNFHSALAPATYPTVYFEPLPFNTARSACPV